MKIKVKLSIIIIAIMIVVITVLAVIFLQQASNISLNLSRQSISYLAQQQASYWQGREDAYIRVLRTVANVMADYETVEPELRRNRYDTLLHGVLMGESMITSIYSVWKANALDGMDNEFIGREGSSASGQYAMSYAQEGSVIRGSALSQIDITTAVANMDGQTARDDMVFDPVPQRVDGADTWLVRMAVPVINPRTGETVARVGCYIKIDAVQTALAQTVADKGEEVSTMMMYTNTGFIMGHVAPERVGRKLLDVETFGDQLDDADRAVKEGRPHTFEYYSTVVNSNVELIMVPFTIGLRHGPWRWVHRKRIFLVRYKA